MTYTPFNPVPNTPVQQNPHSPATSGYKQQPVEMPGVISQTNNLLYKPFIDPNKDNK